MSNSSGASQSTPVIRRYPRTAYSFDESLGETLNLEMVLIPGGSFMMGSPDTEEGHFEYESPQHLVTVPTFFMGKYPVTQAQYEVMMGNNPSYFQGANRPVESVTWHDAVEFCDRLSRQSHRDYRLPSEAEWEYACRAGTTTPFHFGKTIDAEVANYRAEDLELGDTVYPGKYGKGRLGEFRQQTTPVGNFKVANAFGLYDMHGNVWEWCLDHWHGSYEEAPNDGSAWISENDNYSRRLLRGGSWYNPPRDCRSACRHRYYADIRNYGFGFRVVCAAARTQT
jgi:formylglycine-generating enzyme required for sulfatase activity